MSDLAEIRLKLLPDFLQVEYHLGDAEARERANRIMMSINPFDVDTYCRKLAEEE